MMSFTEIENSIETLSQQVSNASAAARNGEIVNVTDLPKVVDFLCLEINKLSKSDRSKVSTKLLSLVEELDNLTITISSSLEKVKVEMQETTTHNRAARAYTSANTTGKK
ncbi:hypothetical protein [Kiloniella sp.]|uniref:hypothetical protein n=1 Tax=Kiloniella sp. TaxID=1938587 RepID=UPI003B02558C